MSNVLYRSRKCHTVLRSDRKHLTFPDIYSNPWLKKKVTIFGGFQSSVLSLGLVLFYFRPMREDSCMEKCSLIYFEMFFLLNLFSNATIKGNEIKIIG